MFVENFVHIFLDPFLRLCHAAQFLVEEKEDIGGHRKNDLVCYTLEEKEDVEKTKKCQ